MAGIQASSGRTTHMSDRMRQRQIADDEISVIFELGEWNQRMDRLVLTAQACAQAEEALRKEIADLEHQQRHAIQ